MSSCIAPSKIASGDLIAYIDGTAETAVVQHVLQCDYCQAEIAALRQADLLLTQELYRADCPDMVQLLQFVAGFLVGEEKTAVSDHVATCPHCTQEIAQLAVEEASAVVETQPTLTEQLRRVGSRILEAIQLPAPSELGLAVRGQQEMGQIYQAENYQIIVGIQAPDLFMETAVLEGQVLNTETGLPASGGTVSVFNGDERIATQPINDFGHFEFEGLGTGAYQIELTIAATGTEIHLRVKVP